ncbi:MAG: glycosyltransferase family 9 protein [Flavobacteriales bacterium]
MNKILVIQTAFIGDVILATGVVETLRSEFPDAQIDFLLRKGNESLLANNASLNKVVVWNKKEGKWKSMIRIVKQLRKEKYDAVFNLQRFFSSGLMTCFSGAKSKVDLIKIQCPFATRIRQNTELPAILLLLLCMK